MHNIQRHIMKQLIENDARRYSQLRPERVEPNQFVYHLKQLMTIGLVAKHDDGYGLTPKGRAYADKLDGASFDIPWDTQPRNVLFLAVRDDTKGWLLVQRDKQPTYGKVGFASTNMRIGEAVSDTAQHYLHNEYGLAAKFSYICSGSITLYRSDSLESYVVFHLLYAENPVGETANTHARWLQAADMASSDILPSTPPLLTAITNRTGQGQQFIELTYSL